MKIKNLKAKNFLSLKQVQWDLDNQGLVLIKGENKDNDVIDNNGSGKSSLTEALIYALYGKTIRGLTGDGVVHNRAKKNTYVTVELEDDNGDIYNITRYRKHKEFKNSCVLLLNGKDISPKSEKDFTETISNILQMDYTTFTSSILYTAQSFRFTSASDSEIKKSFDKMLNLDVLSKALEITKTELALFQKDQDHLTKTIISEESQIKFLLDDLHMLMENKGKFEESTLQTIAEAEGELKHNTLNIRRYKEREKEFAVSVHQLKEDLKDLDNQLTTKSDENSKELEEVEDELKETQKSYDELVRLERRLNGDLTDSKQDVKDLTKKANKTSAQRTQVEENRTQTLHKVGSPCPVCNRPLEKQHMSQALETYDQQLEELDETKENLEKRIDKTESKIKKIQKNLKQLAQAKETLEEEIEELTKQKNRLTKSQKDRISESLKERSTVEKNYNTFSTRLTQTQEHIKFLQDKIDSLKQTIENAKNKENPFVKLCKAQEEKIKSKKTSIKQAKQDLEKLEGEVDCLKFWVKHYSNSGIKSLILDDITPFLNKRVNKYLQKLSNGQIEVLFSTQTTLKSGEVREKFSIDIFNQDGGTTYASNSTGEKKRVDICVNLALQDLVGSRSNKKINLAIFDEVFDGLDESGIDSVAKLLKELSKDKSSVFVISHNPHLQALFNKQLTIVKEDGYSTVV